MRKNNLAVIVEVKTRNRAEDTRDVFGIEVVMFEL